MENQLRYRLTESQLDCWANVVNSRVSIKPGKKYTKVDVGGSGRYMVDTATGEIFGIKGYGQIHKGHRYGTLDTTATLFWGDYKGQAMEQRFLDVIARHADNVYSPQACDARREKRESVA